MESSDNLDGYKNFLTTVLEAVSLMVGGINTEKQKNDIQLKKLRETNDMQQKINHEQAATVSSLNQKLGKRTISALISQLLEVVQTGQEN